jgi:SAM-dependent methyltransferase
MPVEFPSGASDACIACAGARWRVRHRIREFTIEQCAGCGLGRTRGADFDFAEFYDRGYFEGSAEAKGYNDYFALAGALRKTNRKRVRRLRRLLPDATRLLDVGCGPGFFLTEAARGGLEVRGLEVSPFAAGYGRARHGLNIACGPIDTAHLPHRDASFDLITLWDVIEHLPAPADALALLAERLSPGGVLALSTGDVASPVARLSGRRWHLYNLPEHLWFFNARSLGMLLERAGLVVERVEREVCWYTTRYLLDRLMYTLGRGPILPGRLRWLERLTVPFSLFDIVTLHARKPVAEPGLARPSQDTRRGHLECAQPARDALTV